MIDRNAFIKRLQHVLDQYNLTAAAFADKVQVGRATISHILLGRNKPSLEFVLKVIKAFPEVDLYWLLEGVKKDDHQDTVSQQEHLPLTPTLPNITNKIKQSKNNLEQAEILNEKDNILLSKNPEKIIKRILLLYEDGSFESYI